MIPDVKILKDTQDITAALHERLLSLSIHDEAGFKSDALDLKLDDAGGRLDMPQLNEKLTVFMGYKGKPLVMMGIYRIDQVDVTGAPRTLSIRAQAAPQDGAMTSQHSKTWKNITVKAPVETIAYQHKEVVLVFRPLFSLVKVD